MYEASFYGELIGNQFDPPFNFQLQEIYVRGRPLSKDSFAASKLFSNMQVLSSAKEFAFTTMSGSEGHLLNDAVGRLKTFRIRISAFIANYELRVLIFDCELLDSRIMRSPFGTAQYYRIKFQETFIEQVAASSGSRVRPRGFFGSPRILILPGPFDYGF